MPLAASIALPPPTATKNPQPLSPYRARPSITVSSRGLGVTLQKSSASIPEPFRTSATSFAWASPTSPVEATTRAVFEPNRAAMEPISFTLPRPTTLTVGMVNTFMKLPSIRQRFFG